MQSAEPAVPLLSPGNSELAVDLDLRLTHLHTQHHWCCVPQNPTAAYRVRLSQEKVWEMCVCFFKKLYWDPAYKIWTVNGSWNQFHYIVPTRVYKETCVPSMEHILRANWSLESIVSLASLTGCRLLLSIASWAIQLQLRLILPTLFSYTYMYIHNSKYQVTHYTGTPLSGQWDK